MAKTRIAVLVSGSGSNFAAVLEKIRSGEINGEIVLVLSSKPDAYALIRAEEAGIPTAVCSARKLSREDFSRCLEEKLAEVKPDLILLAGFLSILSADLINQYPNRIMNIHPSLLPAFGGKGFYGERVHQAVLAYGAKVSGASVIFVTEEADAGPIILQEALEVRDDDTAESLAKRVLELEHRIFPRAVRLFTEGRIRVEGRKVYISPEKKGRKQ